MSAPPQPSPPSTPQQWPVLSTHERRVLGVLAEKQKTTPDSYPLSLNGLLTGCNQKSNRDPILNLSDVEVEDALAGAQKKGLAIKLTGTGRVEKWRHNLYESWKVDKVEMAVLIELLLRGPQTEGELRSRVSRMEPVDDLDALRNVLRPLKERRLIVYLTPEGRRGTTLTHGFHAPDDLERVRAAQPAEAFSPTPAAPPPSAGSRDETVTLLKTGLTAAQAEIVELRGEMAQLRATVTNLAEQVRQIKDGLGI
jgi:uncharacterized protein YceH (UPF0502 family)